MTFTALIDGFKGLFSRSFWFGSFLPVAIVGAAHLSLSAWLFGRPTATQIKDAMGDEPGTAALIVVGLVVLAYMLAPITPMLNGLLDGSLLPGWLHDRLRRERAGAWRKQVRSYRKAQMALGAVSNRRFVDQLRKEMNRPAKPRTPADDEATIQSAIRDAIEMAETLLKEIEDDADAKWGQSLDPSPAIDLGKLLEARAALVAAPFAEVDALNSVEPVPEWTNRATLALQKILALHGDAESEARHRLNAVARRMPTLDPRDWQATRLGDARYARDSYVRDTYGASFDYLWPKVRMAVGDGEADDAKAVARSVADAASLVDFAALLLVLALTIPAVWLPVIIVNDKPVFAFLAIGVGAPIALAMFYELLIRAEMAFGIVVQNIVDRYHLAIFPMLSLPVPATLSAERDLWSRVEQASWSSAGVDLVYKLPATTT